MGCIARWPNRGRGLMKQLRQMVEQTSVQKYRSYYCLDRTTDVSVKMFGTKVLLFITLHFYCFFERELLKIQSLGSNFLIENKKKLSIDLSSSPSSTSFFSN